MTKSKIFFWLSLFFIAGIGSVSFYYPKTFDAFWLFVFFIMALIAGAVFYENKKALVASFVVLFFIGGSWLTTQRLQKVADAQNRERNFSGEVTVLDEPSVSGAMQNFIVSPPENKKEKFLVSTSAYQKVAYGEKWQLDCALKIPKNLDQNFDYRMYLAAKGVFYACEKPKLKLINNSGGNQFYTALLKTKNSFEGNINRLIPYPESGLLVGLILGGSHQLTKEIQSDFSRTGLSHVTAVSGYNVTIVAECLMILGIALGLWRRQAFWFSAFGIILFVIITGFSASAVRSGVMGILLIWAMKNGRLANSQNAILFSADVMLFFNPLLLRYDVGFQLSFLATLGIIYIYPIANEYLVKKNKVFGLSEILFLTLSAQIFVLPVLLVNFNQLSLISPLANLLILPFIPFTMMLGFLAAIAGFIFNPVAIFFSWLAFLPLRYEMLVVNNLSKLSYAAIPLTISWWEVVIWYIILVWIIVRINLWQKENQSIF